MGTAILLEMLKEATIRPSHKPVAPIFLAYRGKRGATNPIPSVEANILKAKIGKTFFSISVIEHYNPLMPDGAI